MGADLVAVSKGGETLLVHPTCVAAHLAAGWQPTELPPETPAPAPTTKPKRGQKGAAQPSMTEATNGDR